MLSIATTLKDLSGERVTETLLLALESHFLKGFDHLGSIEEALERLSSRYGSHITLQPFLDRTVQDKVIFDAPSIAVFLIC